MGLFDGLKRIKDPVRGSAQIVSMSGPPDHASSANCRMQLVVSVPGHPSFAVDDEYMVKIKKWPSPGQTLPIEASQSDPTKFKILWDEIVPWDQRGAAQAQQLAEAMNQQPTAPQAAAAGRRGRFADGDDQRPAGDARAAQAVRGDGRHGPRR